MAEYGEAALDFTPEQSLAFYAAMARRKRRDDLTEYVLNRSATAAGFGDRKTDEKMLKALK